MFATVCDEAEKLPMSASMAFEGSQLKLLRPCWPIQVELLAMHWLSQSSPRLHLVGKNAMRTASTDYVKI